MRLPHLERRQWVESISSINQELNDGLREAELKF